MGVPDVLKEMKIGDLDAGQTELLYGVLEALQSDVTLEGSKSLSFLADAWASEKAKGKKANKAIVEGIEAIATPYNFAITHNATSKDSKYGVFVLEEVLERTTNMGRRYRWTAYKVDKDGTSEIFSDESFEKSGEDGKIKISHVADKGIVLSVRDKKTILV